jgi:hypothetical protein
MTLTLFFFFGRQTTVLCSQEVDTLMDEQRGTSYDGGCYSYDRGFVKSRIGSQILTEANTDLVKRWGEGGIIHSRRKKAEGCM